MARPPQYQPSSIGQSHPSAAAERRRFLQAGAGGLMTLGSARTACLGLGAALVSSVSPGAAGASTFPDRPIKLVLGFPPGGATDNSARMNAARMAEFLGQPIVVENKPGASGSIAAQTVARSEPDGYTLFYTTSTIHGINPNVYARLPYDPVKDFDPVIYVSRTALVLLVRHGLEVGSTADFLALARARPGKLTYGTAGIGSTQHLAAAMLCHKAGIEALHVPYKGSGPAQSDLASGQIDFMLDTVSASLTFIRTGKVRALATTGLAPSKTLPDLPTVDAAGVKGYQVAAWGGFVVPRGTPRPVIARLNDAGNRTLADPEFVARALAMGSELQGGTPEAFGDWIGSELANWRSAVEAAGVPRQ